MFSRPHPYATPLHGEPPPNGRIKLKHSKECSEQNRELVRSLIVLQPRSASFVAVLVLEGEDGL